MAIFKMINKYFLVVLIVLISGCQASNQTKGNANASSSTSFTVTDNLPRLALVIGNSNYQKASSLANPLNDAADMAAVLRSLNFNVILKQDIDHSSMKDAVNNFTRQLKKSKGIGLFYFSGHGLQDNNSHNYLIPVNADIKTQADMKYQAVNSNWVLDKMTETQNRLNVVILDACRDNLPQQTKGYIKKGLAAMQGSLGSLVAYATAPNTSALGSERKRNSVYTEYLVKALKTKSNLSVSDMLTYVTNKVAGETDNQQIPWQSGSMKDIFCFSRCGYSNEQAAEIASLKAKLRSLEQQIITPTIIKPKPDLVAGKVFQDRLKDGSLGPKMVVIPSGSFTLYRQSRGWNDEQPVHRVSVRKFAMGVYEITFAEYDKFVEATGRRTSNDYGWERGNRPVINVSWNDATAYAKWLSNQTGKNYRIPTEAEWEYATRAGTETKYWRVNSGNVWEWMCDEYNGKEKQCVKSYSRLSIRGYFWDPNARSMRSASRFRNTPTNRIHNVGFRVSRQ